MLTATGTLLLLLVGTWGLRWAVNAKAAPARTHFAGFSSTPVSYEQWCRPDPTPAPPVAIEVTHLGDVKRKFIVNEPQGTVRYGPDNMPQIGAPHPVLSGMIVSDVLVEARYTHADQT